MAVGRMLVSPSDMTGTFQRETAGFADAALHPLAHLAEVRAA